MIKIYVPVCASCGTKMKCKKNDFILGSKDGDIDTRWNGDLFSCPQCSVEVVVGFGAPYKGSPNSEPNLHLKCNPEPLTNLK